MEGIALPAGWECWRYAAVLLACLLLTLPLEFVLGARVYRRPRRLLLTLLPVVALFGTWDVLATRYGSWTFTARSTLGPRLLGLPLEEWLFFVVVPICGMLSYEAVGPRRHRAGRDREGTDAR